MWFTLSGTHGASDPHAWLDWDLALTPEPAPTTCENMDPGVLSDDPYAYFSRVAWGLTVPELDPLMAKRLKYWAPPGPEAFAGGDFYVNGASVAALFDAPQWRFTFAWSMDAGLNVSPDLYLTQAELEGGADGYYAIVTGGARALGAYGPI